jgi:hypothetical protein
VKNGVRSISRLGVLLFAVTLTFGWTSGACASGRAETLEAIHAVENPHDSTLPGRYGELGPYQFRRSTWRMHTGLPFEQALDRSASDEVAIRHYEWLKRGLTRSGLAPTPYNIALAWNGGLSATIRGRVTSSAHNYAERVNNLALELSTARLASVR